VRQRLIVGLLVLNLAATGALAAGIWFKPDRVMPKVYDRINWVDIEAYDAQAAVDDLANGDGVGSGPLTTSVQDLADWKDEMCDAINSSAGYASIEEVYSLLEDLWSTC
jgi:hypothetical protein